MKKRFIFLFSIIICAVSLNSCFEDKSKLPVEGSGIQIDPEGQIANPIRLGFREELNLSPNVVIGSEVNSEDISCYWELSSGAGGGVFEMISEERVLDIILDHPVSSGFYTLVMTVVDNRTGNRAQRSWNLSISSFGAGIIVADTRDGQTGDITLIMDQVVSEDYEGELSIRYNLNETMTGEALPAPIRSINYGILGSTYGAHYNVIMTVLENNEILYFNCNDYSKSLTFTTTVNINGVNQTIEVPLELTTGNILPNRTSSNVPAYITPFTQVNLLVMDEQLYSNSSVSYSNVTFMNPDAVTGGNHIDNSVISVARNPSDVSYAYGPEVIWYDNQEGKMFQWSYFGDKGVLTDNTGFNPSNLPGRRAIAGGIAVDGVHHALLLKNTSEGIYEIYTVQENYDDWSYVNHPLTTKPVANVPASVTAAIDASVSCVFSMYESILFVVTENQIIAVNFADPFNVTSSVKYTAASGETMTMGIQFLQGGYHFNASAYGPPEWVENYGYKPIFPLTANALVVGVQTGTYSGKVLVIPQKNRGSGDLDVSNITTYPGFGKITDLTIQSVI